MREQLLHYVWKNGFISPEKLKTTDNKPVRIISGGIHNHNAGPDFLEAKIIIGDILWVGNVEIHKYSSDWYAHHHEKDSSYDNVILHIVYEDDMPIYNSQNNQIPTLVLSKYLDKHLLKKYNQLYKSKSLLKCQNDLNKVDSFVILNWKNRLFFDRLEDKYEIVKRLLNNSKNDWNQVLYETLLKYFGGTVNKDSFELLAKFLPYVVFKNYLDNPIQLEALLFGVSGFLENENPDDYYRKLKEEFIFLKHKHNLDVLPNHIIKFHRLRPLSFPTIRLAQFAQLYHKIDFLFEKIIKIQKPKDAYKIFGIAANEYWCTHYNFNKKTKVKTKKVGKKFIDLIIINVIVPLKFAYQKHFDQYDEEEIIDLITSIKPEENRIINTFKKLDLTAQNAMDTQAIIQLNQKYCTKDLCLQCDIGHFILKNNIKDEPRET